MSIIRDILAWVEVACLVGALTCIFLGLYEASIALGIMCLYLKGG